MRSLGGPLERLGLALASTALVALVAMPASTAAVQVVPVPAPLPPEAQTIRGEPGSIEDLARLINLARIGAGRLPLAESSELNVAAMAHSRDMVERNFLDHVGSDGSSPQERAERAGYHVPPRSGWIVVEVISAISADPIGPLSWWLNESPAIHGKVLMDARWREMGLGYAKGGEYGNYWTVLVACRPGVVPTVTFQNETYQHAEECGPPDVAGVMVDATQTPLPSDQVAPGPLAQRPLAI
jgi:uncharacterized protein YkwD